MGEFIGTTLDKWIIAIYFIAILAFGSIFGRFTKSTKDFFFGGQRFSWWLIAMSCVATVVGSYSFIKYSQQSFLYGMSSTMTYLNDWFIIPFFIFGWLPIIYFSRVTSIPEYFERRFDRRTRAAATAFIMLYLIGYVGINLYTLGVAMESTMNINLYTSVIIIAVICAIYVTAGGQTAVIMTDLVQGFLLLIAGFILFFLGIRYIGGIKILWENLPVTHRLPFSGFNTPDKFPGVGIFWQDAMANSLAFYFMNQGVIMRFLSAKSVREGKKAIFAVVLVLMPIATLAIANAGWIGRAMVNLNMLPQNTSSEDIFVVVANLVCKPGVFGVIMAALTAALMSTVDTLINAISAIFVNDIWTPYIRPDATDRHYLFTARWFGIVATILGVALVPVFKASGTIYEAHGMFTAAVTPPMVVAIIFGAFWKRYTPEAAFYTLIGGGVAIALSFIFKEAILGNFIFSFGVGAGGYAFIRAFYGLAVSIVIGIAITFFSKPAEDKQVEGYVIGTIKSAMEKFKGEKVEEEKVGKPVRVTLLEKKEIEEGTIHISADDLMILSSSKGDILYATDTRWWLGGLRSIHVKVGKVHENKGIAYLCHDDIVNSGLLKDNEILIEKII